MLQPLRLIFMCMVVSAGLQAAVIESSFSLLCELDGQRVPVAAVTGEGKIQVTRDGKIIEVPKQARWILEGDLRSNAAFIYWSPNYSIKRRPEPDLIKDPQHPAEASVNVHYAPPSNKVTEFAGGGLRHSWPETSETNEILVIVWVVEGRITRVAVDGLDPRKGSASARFLLTHEEAAGQPALLLWSGGRFFAPRPQFADTIDARALMAAMLDDWPSLEPMVRANPKLGSKTTTENIPLLHMAAEAGALRVVEGLVAADPKARPRIKDRKTEPMDWSAGNGRVRTVELLLAKGFDRNSIDKDSRTPLLRACSRGHSEVVSFLLKAGADPEIESQDTRSPITEAVDNGYIDIVEMLEPKVKPKFSDSADNRGVLRTQARKGHAGVVRWLLKKGISPNSDADGLSALAMAALNGHDEAVAALLERKASVTWNDPTTGNTALMYAVSRGHSGCVRLLIGAGAELNVKNKQGSTALHMAAIADAGACAELLLSAGADSNAHNGLAFTALEMALLGQSKEVVVLLTAKGDRINVKSAEVDALVEGILRVDNATLLQRAIEDGWPADSKMQGWSALIAAKVFGAESCLKSFAAAGVKEAAGPDRVVRLREVDVSPVALKVILPSDPRDDDEEFDSQRIVVDALVDARGRLRFAQVLQLPDKRLALAVLDSLKLWEFSPAMKDGQAVAVRTRFPVQLRSSEKRVFQIMAVDEMPKPISQKRPQYPFKSRQTDQEARVLVRYVVNAEGTVEEIEVRERSSRECAEAAVEAVMTWRFTPAKRQGKAVSVELQQQIVFQLR